MSNLLFCARQVEKSNNARATTSFWLLLLGLFLIMDGMWTGFIGNTYTAYAATPKAATFSVTDCSNSSESTGNSTVSGTLRYALVNYSSGDTIQFNCSGGTSGVYTITVFSVINISNILTIDGNGYNVTLNGSGATQIFTVNNSGNFTLNNLTLYNGNTTTVGGSALCSFGGIVNINNTTFLKNAISSGNGGAIYNSGVMTITNSFFNSNFISSGGVGGGAIYNVSPGMLSISNTNFVNNYTASGSGSGGAIYNTGSISNISYSTFTGNSANISPSTSGGAIYNSGTITTIANSTFSNSVAGNGGAIYNAAGTISNIYNSTFNSNQSQLNGGAFYTYNGNNIFITNSTFIANSSSTGGAAIASQGQNLNILNSTFDANFAGTSQLGSIYATSGSIYLQNTILSHNSLNNNGENPMCAAGNIVDNGSNLSDDNSCMFTAPNSQNNVSNLNLDSLKSNGGSTQTVALLSGNAAFGIATANCPATDQRGFPRPSSTNCDAGAYQATIGDGNNASICSEASLNTFLSGGNYIRFACPPSTTITVTASPNITSNFRSISGTVSLDASPSLSFTLSGSDKYELFNVISGSNFTINNLAIANGSGSGITNFGTITVTNAIFMSNSASLYGGAINNSGTISIIANSTFTANLSAYIGGAIYNNGTINNLLNTTFFNNNASGYGGAIYNEGKINATNLTIVGSFGTAIYNVTNYYFNLANSILAKNSGNNSVSGNCGDNTTQIIDKGYNLSDDNTCNFGSSSRNSATALNLANTLQNNGGTTPTLALLSNSTALGFVSSNCPTTDQRGVARPATNCDAGAYEFTPAPNAVSLIVTGGNTQSAPINTTFPIPFQVTAEDATGKPVAGIVVTFTASASAKGASGTFTNGTYTFSTATNVQGIATAPTFTANNVIGSYNVTAIASQTTVPAVFNLYNSALTANPPVITTTTTANQNQQSSLSVGVIPGGPTVNWTVHIAYYDPVSPSFAGKLAANTSNIQPKTVHPKNEIWGNVVPATGTSSPGQPVTATVTVNTTGLSCGTHNATVYFTDNSDPTNDVAVVNVSLNISNCSYYVPFLANSYNNFTTYTAIQNSGTTTATVSVQYFKAAGILTSQSNSDCTTIAPGGECILSNPFGTGAYGGGIISSNQPLSIIVAEGTQYGGSAYTINQGEIGSTLFIPFAINNAGGFKTQITVANFGNATTSGTIKFYDSNGNHLSAADKTFSLGVNSIITNDTTANNALPAGFYGWAEVDGAAGSLLTAQVLEQNPSNHFVAIANAQLQPSTQVFVPAMFNNAYGGFYTGANIVNPTSVPVNVTITYYDLSGKAYSAAPFQLNAYSVQPIFQGSTGGGTGLPANGLPDKFVGTALVTATATTNVAAGTNYGVIITVNEAGGLTAKGTSRSGVYNAGNAVTANVDLPVIANNGFGGFTTGVTIFNTSNAPVSGIVTYYNLDGTPTGITQTFTNLAPYASYATYQGAANLPANFYGTAVVTETGGGSGNGGDLAITANVQSDAFFYTYTEPN